MSGATSISNLPVATSLSFTDLLPVQQGQNVVAIALSLLRTNVLGNDTVLLEWGSGFPVAAGTYFFWFKAPYDGVVNSTDYYTTTGSFTASVTVGGVAIPALANLNVNSVTPTNKVTTNQNTFTKGQQLALVVTNPSGSPAGALFSLNIGKLP